MVGIVKNEKQEHQHHNTNGKYTAIKYESEYTYMCVIVIHDTEASSRVLRALCQETRDAPLEHEQAFAALPLFGVSDYKYY